MKILFTGCTAKQTSDMAWQRARVKRIDDSTIICDSLRRQGYDVTRKSVQIGEDLSQYDLAIVGLGQFGSLNYSGSLMNAFYTIGNCKQVIVFYEDWKINSTIQSYEGVLSDEAWNKVVDKRLKTGQPFYANVDHPLFDSSQTHQTIQNIVDGKYPALIPAFDWGDKQLVRDVIKSEKIYNVDLTPYVLQSWHIPLQVEPQIKKKRHMLASLVNHSGWVRKNKLQWDVDYFGAKSMPNAIQLPTETDVFKKCGEYWSILCPEYPHAGSGWFRVRWVYAAIHGSVLVSSPKDMEALGVEWRNVEELNDNELHQYAREMKEAVFKHMWTTDQFDQAVAQMVQDHGITPSQTVGALEAFF